MAMFFLQFREAIKEAMKPLREGELSSMDSESVVAAVKAAVEKSLPDGGVLEIGDLSITLTPVSDGLSVSLTIKGMTPGEVKVDGAAFFTALNAVLLGLSTQGDVVLQASDVGTFEVGLFHILVASKVASGDDSATM